MYKNDALKSSPLDFYEVVHIFYNLIGRSINKVNMKYALKKNSEEFCQLKFIGENMSLYKMALPHIVEPQ